LVKSQKHGEHRFWMVLGLGLAMPVGAQESSADEVARAEAYADAACQCMFDQFRVSPVSDTGMKICLDQANTSHDIPTDVTETFTVQTGPTTVTHPKLFVSDEANQTYAGKQQACMLRFSTALQGYQSRDWSEDAICMSQCADEGDQRKLCNEVCMSARLPQVEGQEPAEASDGSAEPLLASPNAACAGARHPVQCADADASRVVAHQNAYNFVANAAKNVDALVPNGEGEEEEEDEEDLVSCEDECAHLSGRSKYACERKCEKAAEE
jgi:hypothetical protein